MNSKIFFLIATTVVVSIGYGEMANAVDKTTPVVYEMPNMDQVVVRNVVYQTINNTDLTMDIYYPPDLKSGSQLPVVIFAFSFADSTMLSMIGSKLKDTGQYTCWGRLVAAPGLIGVAYETQEPPGDIDKVISHIRENGASLDMDVDRICIWSCSSNPSVALPAIMQKGREYIRCAVVYYGDMNTNFDYWRQDVPFFIVKAGLDSIDLNESIDRFLEEAAGRSVPVVFVDYANGHHAFDLEDNNDESRRIIEETLQFMQFHLLEDIATVVSAGKLPAMWGEIKHAR
jgi:hypothetical protein